LLKSWIALSTGQISIQWIATHPVDSTIHPPNNWGLVDSAIQPLNNWGLIGSLLPGYFIT